MTTETHAAHRYRFAPSPTGALHIGGARTALYNWLAARHAATGVLILRIEDTDRERSTTENVDQILDAMDWLGLTYDEGPISQAGRAYRGTPSEEPAAAIRLRVPDDGVTIVEDLIHGPVAFPNASYDDFVIARADDTVLYNFAVAVDDAEMGVTEVVRGDDHLSNTPKQLLVLRALGHEAPRYAHLPLLHGPDGKKLSKRHGAASVQELRDAGYLPEAVDNYIALLGAGFAADEEHFSLAELAERFRLDRVSKNPAIFDEKKLRHMNGEWLRELPVDELTRRLERYTGRDGLREAVEISREKIQTLADFWPLVGWAFDGAADDPAAFERTIGREGGAETLRAARDALAGVE